MEDELIRYQADLLSLAVGNGWESCSPSSASILSLEMVRSNSSTLEFEIGE